MTSELSRRGSIPNAVAWMIGLSALLFWMPVVGGLIAGYVGGHKAGTPARGALAAILPALVFWAVTTLLAGVIVSIPIIGQIFALLWGMGSIVMGTVQVIPLLIGALIGGYTAQ